MFGQILTIDLSNSNTFCLGILLFFNVFVKKQLYQFSLSTNLATLFVCACCFFLNYNFFFGQILAID